MGVRIIIDSAADMEKDCAAAHDVTVIPLTTTFSDGEYAEDIDITREEFYEKLIEEDDIPRTSQIPPHRFKEAFDQVVRDGDTAVVVLLSGKLSGTVESAQLAADGLEDTVFIVDSLNASLGERVLVERAITLRDEGLSAREIAAQLDDEKLDVRLVALLGTLEYLKRGGRISAATAAVGGLLQIKPVIGIMQGEVVILGKARGSKQGNNLLREKIAEAGGVDFARPIQLGYTGLSDKLLRKYISDNQDLYKSNLSELPRCIVGSTIGTHAGPGAIGVAFFEPKK